MLKKQVRQTSYLLATMTRLLKTTINPSLALLCLGFCLCFVGFAQALEFRSIASSKAIMLDAPSLEAKKIYILSQGYPVEVIVNLDTWVKVRDQQGGLSWVESKHLTNKRMLLVTGEAEIKSKGDSSAELLASVEHGVVLELLSSAIKNGWVKVKHRDGITGYIQSHLVWGLN
jgi:SH3-like domain-containing protein